MRPKRRLEALETAGHPSCTPWSGIDLHARSGARSRLALRGLASFEGRSRVHEKRLTAHCRRASPAECRTDLLAPEGVYDVTPATLRGTPIGRVRVDVERGIEMTIHYDALSYTQLRGRVQRDDTVELTGEDVMGGDALQRVSGVARFEAQERGVTVTVTFQSELGPPVSYTLFRPSGGTPPALGGRHRFLLEAVAPGTGSVLELDLDLPASGVATSPPGTDHDAGGTIIAQTDGGRCLVTPAGGIHCLLSYAATAPEGSASSSSLFFFGTLGTPDRGSGAGAHYIGAPPTIVRSGPWNESSVPLTASTRSRAAAANRP